MLIPFPGQYILFRVCGAGKWLEPHPRFGQQRVAAMPQYRLVMVPTRISRTSWKLNKSETETQSKRNGISIRRKRKLNNVLCRQGTQGRDIDSGCGSGTLRENETISLSHSTASQDILLSSAPDSQSLESNAGTGTPVMS